MKKLFTKWKWLQYVEAITLIVVGVLVISFYPNPNLHAAIGYIVGVFFLLNALLLIISSLAFGIPLFDGDFVSGLFLLTISIWLLVDPMVLINSLPLILGVILIGYGLIMITRSIIALSTIGGASNVWWLIGGCLSLALGITVITLQYSGNADFASFILLILGIVILVAGIVSLCDTIYISHHAHKVHKEINKVVGTVDDKDKK